MINLSVMIPGFCLLILAGLFVAVLAVGIWPAIRERGVVFALFALAFLYSAATKPPQETHLWRFEFMNGVTDRGSFCTNDLICAQWNYSAAALEYTLRAAYQDLTITNAVGECTDPLHQLPDALVMDGSHIWEVANATNMRVVVYATYVPPVVVHTNGVYHLSGVMPSINDDSKYVTPGVTIYVHGDDGTRILTPTNAPPMPAFGSLQSNEE